jgi:transcriptional regulator with XRE-family HTH domain
VPEPIVVDPAVHAARVAAFKADVLARAPALRTGPKGGTLPDPEKHPWKTNGAELPGEAVPEPDALRARREALGVTQREFAGLLGLTRGSWAAVESGTRPGIGHRRHAHSVLARLEDGTLQVQADPRAESVRQRVAALKAQYASLPPEQRVFDEREAGPEAE